VTTVAVSGGAKPVTGSQDDLAVLVQDEGVIRERERAGRRRGDAVRPSLDVAELVGSDSMDVLLRGHRFSPSRIHRI
jgi:hypothetical protein